MYVSHVSEDGRREEVRDHLREVSEMAAEFARPFGAESWAGAAGALHDIGKCSPEFQERILNNGPIVDHSTAGAFEAYKLGSAPMLAYCIAGHHAGMPDGGKLHERLCKAARGDIPDYASHAVFDAPSVSLPRISKTKLSSRERGGFSSMFATRMVFSCLVDADRLCAERFERNAGRDALSIETPETLLQRLLDRLQVFNPPFETLDRTRCSVLDAAAAAGELSPGVYSLTVPTGGGKTYASSLFALRHAACNGMSRVVYAAPYTSIIGQTAEVFREALGDSAVLEHHSAFDFDRMDDDDSGALRNRLRLAAENWDAPVVVTTNVQLLESLFSNQPSRCRKLHNIAGSVIILDEPQLLPVGFIGPCVRALAELVANYGCSVLLCSATQPALGTMFAELGFPLQEVYPDSAESFDTLTRVSYTFDGSLSDNELCERISACSQVLCIVNSRRQALSLCSMVSERLGSSEGLYCLTTYMHPVHRLEVLAQVRKRLKKGLPCRVVSTSLVEAGVDVDFPVVYRALCGVDSIVQAAGRCNREGRLPASEAVVHVFDAATPYNIPVSVSSRAELTRDILNRCLGAGVAGSFDFGDLDVVSEYFDRLLSMRETDSEGVLDLAEDMGFLPGPVEGIGVFDAPFSSVSGRFRLVDDASTAIVIPDSACAEALARVCAGKPRREDMRCLARYSATVYDGELSALLHAGAVEELVCGTYLLTETALYSREVGLDTRSLD